MSFNLGDGRDSSGCYSLRVVYELIREAEKVAPRIERILEVGCGDSPTGGLLARMLLADITQIDKKDCHGYTDADFQTVICGDMEAYEFGDVMFDISFAQGVLGWISGSSALNIAKRMADLSKHGVIVVDDPERKDYRSLFEPLGMRTVSERKIPLRNCGGMGKPHCDFSIWTFAK